jgi:ribonucleoside-diphosphate reductase alpha chain
LILTTTPYKKRDSNLRHRPVGMGIMGFQDCLHMMRVPYASNEAVQFADTSMEAVCYYAYLASTELAEERGTYSSYKGSLWDRGILPQDSLKLLAEERGGYLEADFSETMDWTVVRDRIKQFGMRNSNCVAIAPTATISNIIGVSACIEPTYQNLYVKSNLSGEFTEINEYLVRDLKLRGLWDEVMIADLKYFDGSLARMIVFHRICAICMRRHLKSAELAGRSSFTSSEMDRSGAIPEYLYGRRIR